MLQVMIVDDMDIVRRELKRLTLWERNGFVISGEAKNGHEALEKLEEAEFDMVITDIRMPKIDGIELLKRITGRRLCPCVILYSDYSEFKYARQGLVLGAFDYIVKPADEAELEELLNRASDFILDKKLEQQKLQLLEKKLEEKVDVFFPQAEFDQLIDAIESKDERISEYAGNIADISFINLGQDLVKAKSLLKSVLYQFKNRLMENYKWLDKFIGSNEIGAADLTKADEAAALKEIFVSEITKAVDTLNRLKPTAQGKGMIEQICSFVLESVDDEISLTTVADALFINKSYISGNFKQKTGESFVEYLTNVKMERAKKLIRDGNVRIYEVGELLGFKDIEYFSRLFKKYNGLSPTEYRQEYRKIIINK